MPQDWKTGGELVPSRNSSQASGGNQHYTEERGRDSDSDSVMAEKRKRIASSPKQCCSGGEGTPVREKARKPEKRAECLAGYDLSHVLGSPTLSSFARAGCGRSQSGKTWSPAVTPESGAGGWLEHRSPALRGTSGALGASSALAPPENTSPGSFLPRMGAARARPAPRRAPRSRVRARRAASGRRTLSSRTLCSGCGPRWNSTSRRRCSSAISAGGSPGRRAPRPPSLPPRLLSEPLRSNSPPPPPRHLPKGKTP